MFKHLWLQVDVVEQEEVAEAVAGEEASVAAVVAVAALAAGLPVAGGHALRLLLIMLHRWLPGSLCKVVA